MTSIVPAKGLFGDKTYAVQVRAVFAGGQTSEWGPTFAIIKRNINIGATLYPIISSPVGIRVSWSGTLDPAFDEQWLVKKFDAPITESNFDLTGTVVFRGSNNTNVDIDLNQESIVYIGVVKVDRYGNRSTVAQQSLAFTTPDPPLNLRLQNFSGGFNVLFDSRPPSNQNKYHIVRVSYDEPFTAHTVTNKSKSGTLCSLTVTGTAPLAGDIAQVSIGDARFDGLFKLVSVVGSQVSYVHTTSETVAPSVATGDIIPTSSGPTQEGSEIFRTEITSATPATIEVEFNPQQYGKKVYIAVGTEDSYKNLAMWKIRDANSNIFTYGRNYIAERDAITLASTPNKSIDGFWKYGYIGWKDAHSTSTLDLNTASTTGALRFAPVTGDTPDSIQIGVVNGSITPLSFATDPTSAPNNSQSRFYPGLANNLTLTTDENLSKPIIDDAYYVPEQGELTVTEKRTKLYWNQHPSAPSTPVGLGKVWIECSASNLVNDALNTKHPILVDGATKISGSFAVTPSTWGGSTDDPSAKLSLYAITGDWTPGRAGSLYDPHFYPVATEGLGRVVTKTSSVTNKVKSSTTVTLTLEAGKSVYPDVGESITVSIGDTNCDGTWIVATRASNIITYLTTSATAVASAAVTGSVFVNPAESMVITNRSRTGNLCTITVSGINSVTAEEHIDVKINNLAFDGENLFVDSVSGQNITYKIGGGAQTIAGAAITGGDKRVVKRIIGPDPTLQLVDEWVITKNPDAGMFTSAGVPLTKTLDWSWTAKADDVVSQVRFAWVLDFDEQTFNGSRGELRESSWVAGTSYLIKLNNFAAWPGVNAYAGTGGENEFSDTQYMNNGIDVTGDSFFDGQVAITGDLDVGGGAYVVGPAHVETLSTDGDISVGGKLFTADGDLGVNSGNIYVYSKDYAITNTDNPFGGAGTERTINTIRAATVFPSDTRSYFYQVSWTGYFTKSVNGDDWIFRLYRWNELTDAWVKIRDQVGAGGNGLTGAALFHSGSIIVEDTPQPEFLVTAQRTTGSGSLNAGFSGSGATQADSNRLQVLVFPMSRDQQATRKSTHLGTAPGNSYSSVADSTDSDPNKLSKTTVITLDTGWKASYKGTGAEASATSGDINQGFFSSQNGNEKSAWGFTGSWSVLSGTALPSDKSLIKSPKVIYCRMMLNPTHWGGNGGVAVIGTHNDSTGNKKTNWGNIPGKNPDRKRVSFRSAERKYVDLGITIGKEIWNGYARTHLGGTNTADPTPLAGNAAGILLGPGPTNSSQYYGNFAPSFLKIEMKIEWKE